MIVGLITFCLVFHWYRRPKNFPPGPRGLPLLGVVPWLGIYTQKTFVEWSKKYGSVMSVRMGMEDLVVLNDFESIQEVRWQAFESFRTVIPNRWVATPKRVAEEWLWGREQLPQ